MEKVKQSEKVIQQQKSAEKVIRQPEHAIEQPQMAKRVVLPVQEVAGIVEQTVAQGSSCCLTVTGYSMSPTLQPCRDSVVLVSVKEHPVKKGDILFFQRADGTFVLHRFIRRRKDGSYCMNGDGQVWTEEISKSQILAVVSELERKGKRINSCNLLYKGYVWVWIRFRPFRNIFLKIKRLFQK